MQKLNDLKKIVSILLKSIPRPVLQRISQPILKLVVIFYRGKKFQCPICETNYRKLLPYGRIARENALCPNCLSLERHRLIWIYLKNETDFFTSAHKMLHVAPEHCFIKRFEGIKSLEYVTGDIESPLAKVKMDLLEAPFDDNTFSVVFCNHVLEHVHDDRKAMSEIYRILKPGGWAILQIPLFYPLPEKTIEDPTIEDPIKREELFGQDDHVRKYGLDYRDRLKNTGFNLKDDYLKRLDEESIRKYALDKNDILFVVEKPI